MSHKGFPPEKKPREQKDEPALFRGPLLVTLYILIALTLIALAVLLA